MDLVLTKEQELFKGIEKRFLGKWCINYKASLQDISTEESITLPYPFDAEGKMHASYRYLKKVDVYLFPQFCDMLNQYHQVSHSQRYWRIVVGYWWLEHLSGLYEKYVCLKNAMSSFDQPHVKIINKLDWFTAYDSQDFLAVVKDDFYNHQLLSQVIAFLKGFVVEELTVEEFKSLNFKKIPPLESNKRNSIKKLICFLSKRNKFYIHSNYMLKQKVCQIALRLKIFPTLVDSPRWLISKNRNINLTYRNNYFNSFRTRDEFEKLIENTLAGNIPKIYLEDFYGLKKKIQYFFPKKPIRLILTAASYAHNDGFKAFAAQQTEFHQTPFVIAQHGANYGSAAWNASEEYEKEIADYYLTYGWKEAGNPKVIPFIINLFNQYEKNVIGMERGDILWVMTSQQKYPRMFYAIPRGAQIIEYLNQQAAFYLSLSPEVKEKIRIRTYPHSAWHDLTYLQRKVKQTFHLANTKIKLRKEAKTASLVICTYNSTSILEMFALNIPTLLHWNPQYSPLRPSAQKIYQKLHELNILHYEPGRAAAHLSSIYPNTLNWWQHSEIQQIRQEFCEMFAATSSQYSKTWLKMIENLATKR